MKIHTDELISDCLSEKDIEFFLENGYLKIPQCFSTSSASKCREILWNDIEGKTNIKRNDNSTYPIKLPLDNVYTCENGYPWDDVLNSDKLKSSLKQLSGSNEIENIACGWWMITFPEDVQPDIERENIWGIDGNWHIDGGKLWRYPYLRDIGFVLVMYFSDVERFCGGTLVASGSHTSICRDLIDYGVKGVSNRILREKFLERESFNLFPMVELIGNAGDVYILHPYLLHARSRNLGSRKDESVRFMAHPSISLKNDLDFTKNINELSILEKSIYNSAMGDENLILKLQTTTAAEVNSFRNNKRKYDDIEYCEFDIVDNEDLKSFMQQYFHEITSIK